MADKPSPSLDPSSSPEKQGGVGGSHGRAKLQDLALVRRALRCGFTVPNDKKAEAVKQIGDILADQNAPPRSKIAAARALATLEGVTLASIDVALRAYQQGELADAVAELQAWKENCGQTPPIGSADHCAAPCGTTDTCLRIDCIGDPWESWAAAL
jgi:hypothetical protein